MRMVLRIAVLPLIACAFSACQLQGPASATMPDVHEPDLVSVAAPATRNGPDWERAEDCPGKLFLLQQGLSDGSLIDLEGTPFTLIDHSLPSARSGWSPAQGSVDWGTVASSPLSEVRCIVRIGQAFDQQSEHQVIGREQVRSRYQSGAWRKKNLAYKVAEARLRQAEKSAKPGKSPIIKFGDPLIDLVGTLVGGALTGFGQWG